MLRSQIDLCRHISYFTTCLPREICRSVPLVAQLYTERQSPSEPAHLRENLLFNRWSVCCIICIVLELGPLRYLFCTIFLNIENVERIEANNWDVGCPWISQFFLFVPRGASDTCWRAHNHLEKKVLIGRGFSYRYNNAFIYLHTCNIN